ncbi:MAG TPA: F0F1 ATP synthase subunit A [Candidatus Limnocylindrales bacterium]|nr:F0F1 ATP synthase subunit A [Candidatus Limnocylindrales bacterium]
MRFLFDEKPPVTHPTIDLGCGSWCTVNYDSLISSAIALVVTIVAAILIARSMSSEKPNRVQALAEWAFSYVRSTSQENAPDASSFVVPLAATIGFYILVANYLDFLPITLIPNVHPANTDVNQTAAMAIVVFVLLHWYNIRLRGFRGYLAYYTRPHELPVWARVLFTPLNIIEEIVKPVTLALRLFGNLLAGLLMLYVIGLLLPGPVAVIANAVWKLFDVLFIGLIQAFIFMLLTLVYFGLAREGFEQEHAH